MRGYKMTKYFPTLWTNSYFVSTVGGAPLLVIKQYIERQRTSQRQWKSQRASNINSDWPKNRNLSANRQQVPVVMYGIKD